MLACDAAASAMAFPLETPLMETLYLTSGCSSRRSTGLGA